MTPGRPHGQDIHSTDMGTGQSSSVAPGDGRAGRDNISRYYLGIVEIIQTAIGLEVRHNALLTLDDKVPGFGIKICRRLRGTIESPED